MIRKLLSLLFCAALLMVVAAGLAAWKQHSVLEQPLALDEIRLLDVQAGDTPGGLFRQLEAEGLLQDSLWLRLYWRARASTQTREIQAIRL